YYLSDKMIDGFIRHTENQINKGNGFKFEHKSENEVGNTVTARCFKMGVDDNYIKVKSAATSGRKSILTDYRIRRLTPREAFRLMDFPDSFTWPVSDTQAYKQAGNSICVGVLAAIIARLKL